MNQGDSSALIVFFFYFLTMFRNPEIMINPADLPGFIDEADEHTEKITVQRQDPGDPFMFYRVKQADVEQETVKCFNVSPEVLDTAKRVIQINLVTVTLLMSMLPHNIYNIIVFFTHLTPSESISQVCAFLQVPFLLIFPVAIYKKLVKNHT